MLRLFLCLSLVLAACGDNIVPPPVLPACEGGTDSAAFKTISIWTEADPDLGDADALAGCDLWDPVCLQGAAEASESAAEVRIHALHDACVPDPNGGGYVLAISTGGGDIDVELECLRKLFPPDPDGHISRQVLKLVLGHELGHQSGMWWHVPAACDDGAAASDFEKSLVQMGICGTALMNADLDPILLGITELDVEAYALRDTHASTFPQAAETENGCVLTYRPAH